MTFRSFVAAGLAALTLGLTGAAHATDEFPSRPITFVVPYAPGGPADLIARMIANKMSEFTKEPIIVENRAGAGGNIAGDYIARAKKDGYTLLFGSSPVLVINPALYNNLKFDPLKDFEPIAEFGSLPNAVLVTSNLPVSNTKELIDYAKKNMATYASAGSGGTTHLSGLMFAKSAGVELTHIPFKGSGPALQSLLGDQVTMTFTDVFTAHPFIEAGKLKILGVTSSVRSELFPDVKTLQEQGMKDIDINVFFALLAPAGIPDAVKSKLAEFSGRVLADAEVQQKLKARGLILPPSASPEYLRKKMETETPLWAQLIKETNAKID
ncbi:Bug family tripartite tricarboxylate transporter substrate binding protein [Parapusillimonas granuli]|uniref:Tripartite tricarboxylate transporter substrate binding protein n=1 Tax=Parapusillimonas granuli TaxID=380911 RepID=A0A853FT50_9BURK|nr:tripartite tricarboxylate transporter substrate binding protein [Parapusillimonas granuli]MBB5216102.1 tripartite-type tricarboxylate transporter receptor subunit TctC [Parapusillimonas granuli]MEB2400379.1 tripartite tricarboxylate transporter substrate binding protein [Alcaligenaceae bacterium]NYT47783.1 tripartite tricarboxylate transporter substrate binding protein [Parapusillimonas granuli]